MFCDHCGTKLSPGVQTCPSCGKSFAVSTPMMPPKRGIAGHVRLLGILWIAHGALHAFPGLLLITIFGSSILPAEMPPFVTAFLPLIGSFLLFAGGMSVLAGIGLLMRQSWARVAALILAAISLISIPFGTALGVYTMWALLPSDHEEEYRALTQTA
jgi:hypothetical protein